MLLFRTLCFHNRTPKFVYLSNEFAQAAALPTYVWEVLVRILPGTPTVLTGVFVSLLSPSKQIPGAVP
jgi:hypothetical protein